MMDRPLLVKNLLWRAENVFGRHPIVSCREGAGDNEITYGELTAMVRRYAAVLAELGVVPGTRVGSLAWNTARHLAAYFAVPMLGAVLHTVNQRLPAEHLVHTIARAGDEVLLVDRDLLPIVERIREALPGVRHVVVFGPRPTDPVSGVLYMDELAAGVAEFDAFPELDERAPAGICFTSGTTGMPKGVVYSHRSTVLHALALCVAGGPEVRTDRSYLLATQMSHVNGWGLPHAAALQGARLVLPGPHPAPRDHLRAISTWHPSVLVGSPTVMAMIRDEYEHDPGGYDLSSVRRLWLGGQAPLAAQARWWGERGVEVTNGWGMTEASPTGTFSSVSDSQGRPLPLVEIRVVDPDGRELARDGRTPGELEIRSPWVTGSYLDGQSPESFREGWFRTGDVATISHDGQMAIRDRAKDMIKSGGEWISSIELENHLTQHPCVVEAAVIGVPDERWLERPAAWVVLAGEVNDDELREYVAASYPRYWAPDEFLRVEEIPKTSVGKLDKVAMRRRHAELLTETTR